MSVEHRNWSYWSWFLKPEVVTYSKKLTSKVLQKGTIFCNGCRKLVKSNRFFMTANGLGTVWYSSTTLSMCDRSRGELSQHQYQVDRKGGGVAKRRLPCLLCYIKDYIYSKKKCLPTIESSSIRSTVTKLRLDMNCTWDCKIRSFQYKHVQSDKCLYCNEVHTLCWSVN